MPIHRTMTSTSNPTIYIETSIVSYLTARTRSSRDLTQAARQQMTTKWWWHSRSEFDPYISQFVLDEATRGNAAAAARRLDALEGIPLLRLTDTVTDLGATLVAKGGLPEKARLDALHVAVAAVHGMDYLLTWNCKHIANATHRSRIEWICRAEGVEPPVICTPMELPENDHD